MALEELLLTSVDKDGTKSGMDVELNSTIAKKVNVPVIVSGGVGSLSDVESIVSSSVGGLAIGTLFHYNLRSILDVKRALLEIGFKYLKCRTLV